ncbi:MAG: ABC transporter permease, partial [Gracilimonas sp.]|nr:ABC transporter permease [Gracilimonas sp.]
MLYQFLKISLRNITRHKFFSAINIFGLMLSITICIPAIMIIKHQLEFDDFHPHPDETFRVITQVNYNNADNDRFATTPIPLTEALKEYEFVDTVVPMYRNLYGKASTEEKTLSLSGFFTSPGFFEVFGFDLASGNEELALAEPFSIILTEYNARRFFGEEDPMGKILTIEGSGDFTVTGVLKEIPSNTHIRIGALASFSSLPLLGQNSGMLSKLNSWDEFDRNLTYLKTKEGISKEDLIETVKTISASKVNDLDMEEYVDNYQFDVQTLDEISPGEVLRADIGAGKAYPMENLIILMVNALIILLMACFNYTNLSIARALKRAKEVGVYKVLGAYRWQVITQFVMQSTLIAMVALILAYGLLPWIPLPSRIMAEVQSITPDLTLMVWFLGFVIFTGLLAG